MIEKILVVGDIHADWGRLNALITKKNPTMVLACGDFGWWPKMETRSMTLYSTPKWVCKGVKPGDTIVRWCDGNHEDHEDLDSLGRLNKDEILMYPNVIYQPRGSVYELDDGRRILFFGGGESIDKYMRTPGFDWFDREIPSPGEYARAMDHERIDIVVCHTCPKGMYPKRYASAAKLNDPTTTMLYNIVEKYKPSLVYHGHWHSPDEQTFGDTRVISLDYPGHGGRWWTWLSPGY